jgi:glycosyltransferase involved in cell wall biosynthesis
MLFKWGWFFRFIANAVAQGALIVVYKDYRARTDRVLRCVYLNKVVKFIPSCSAIPAVELSTDERQALRTKYATPNAQMIAYFGLIYESKRVELLFDIADAKDAHLVIIGAWFSESELQFLRKPLRQKLISYYQSLRQLAASATWRNKVTITGFVQANEAARIMAAADAVVLPYLGGGGYWNSSLSAAQSQGTFVLTTSKQHHGYNAEENVYFAPEHDVDEMRKALRQHLGMRAANSGAAERTWQLIRKSHIEFYRRQLSIK